ncbi:hypothetical protein [Paenibacillus sp. MBLB4367]|uniref:hypothetical protein n=1 Tax=Paenibacillus sp. MBLB4367 TaxID=3384767 RepID=UPI0039081BB1
MVVKWSTDDNEEERRKTIAKSVSVVLVVFLALVLAFFSLGMFRLYSVITKATDKLCGNDVLKRMEQSDTRNDLVYFRRDCGATTGFSYHMSLVKRGHSLPNEAGNLFRSNSAFHAFWINEKTIGVNSGGGDAFKKRKAYKGVRIQYDGK